MREKIQNKIISFQNTYFYVSAHSGSFFFGKKKLFTLLKGPLLVCRHVCDFFYAFPSRIRLYVLFQFTLLCNDLMISMENFSLHTRSVIFHVKLSSYNMYINNFFKKLLVLILHSYICSPSGRMVLGRYYKAFVNLFFRFWEIKRSPLTSLFVLHYIAFK